MNRVSPTTPVVLTSLALLLTVSCGSEPEPTAPNVVWICIDTLRADHLGCYGYERPTSPHLDALAADGVQFLNAFSHAPWTKPSVPSFFTARFPVEHRVYEGSSKDQQGRVTSDVLTDRWWTAAEALQERGYRTAGLVHNAHLKPFLGMAQGFETYAEGRRTAAEINAEFWQWLDEGSGPFFAYLHYLDVHWPYRPSPQHRDQFPGPEPELDLSGATSGKLRDRINDGEVVPGEADLAAMVNLYDACIHETDAGLGILFEKLQQQGLWDNTLVVVTSDHGEEFFEHGKIGHGHSLRDSLLKVPLILRGPGLPADHQIPQVVQAVDVLPTILDLLELPPMESSGVSLRPYLQSADREPQPAFAEVLHGRTYQRMIRFREFKLVESYRWQGSRPEAVAGEGATLRPGIRVEVKGEFDDEDFEADRLEVEDSPDQDAEIRGPVHRIDRDRQRFRIGELRVDAAGVKIVRRSDGAELGLADIPADAILDVDGELDDKGRIEADEIEWRDDKDGDTIKLEGVVESIDPGKRRLVLLGVTVELQDEVDVPGWSTRSHRVAAELNPEALADPDVFERELSLYHLVDDPGETHNVTGQHPEVVAHLQRLLTRWADLRRPPEDQQEQLILDAETIEELRRIGYVE